MKRIILFILALALIFTVGCAPKGQSETQQDAEVITADTGYAGVFWYDYGDSYSGYLRQTLDSELETMGVTFADYNAGNDQAVQLEQVRQAVEDGIRVIIIEMVNYYTAEDAQTVSDIAKAADIPLIFVNREVATDAINSYENACHVGLRYISHGETQGDMAGQYILNHYDKVDRNGDGEITYLMMKGDIGPDCEARTMYALRNCNNKLTAGGRPELKYFEPERDRYYITGALSRSLAFTEMTSALERRPMGQTDSIELIIANNDAMALGCIEALNNVGWNNGDQEKTIPVFGIDGTEEAFQAIAEGKLTGTAYPPVDEIARIIGTMVSNTVRGDPVFKGFEEDIEGASWRKYEFADRIGVKYKATYPVQ